MTFLNFLYWRSLVLDVSFNRYVLSNILFVYWTSYCIHTFNYYWICLHISMCMFDFVFWRIPPPGRQLCLEDIQYPKFTWRNFVLSIRKCFQNLFWTILSSATLVKRPWYNLSSLHHTFVYVYMFERWCLPNVSICLVPSRVCRMYIHRP